MGNLLGSPITEKETHSGSSPDGSLHFGVSSMQGWRVHMEDAHICLLDIYAEEPVLSSGPTNTSSHCKNTTPMTSVSSFSSTSISNFQNHISPIIAQTRRTKYMKTSILHNANKNPIFQSDDSSPTTKPSSSMYQRVNLPNHSLFAVFDGHGGSFAAEYAGQNFFRVLSRQPSFVQYAKYVQSLYQPLLEGTATMPATSTTTTTTTTKTTSPPTKNAVDKQYQENTTLNLLQVALRDAFVDLDREILLVERGDLDVEYSTHNSTWMDSTTTDALNFYTMDDDDNHVDDEEEEEEEGDFQTNDDHLHLSPTLVSSKNKKRVLHHSSERLVVKANEDPGCTALVVILTPQFIVCANAGDSRAVYSRNGHRAIALSYDHKPDDEMEKRRIYRAGGTVHAGRVEGDLAVSRGLGDYRFKDTDVVETGIDCFYGSETDESESSSGSSQASFSSQQQQQRRKSKIHSMDIDKNEIKKLRSPDDHMVSPIPDMIVYTRDELQDEFVVLACDGIWDVQSNQECVSTIANIFQEGEKNLGLLCEEVLDVCLKKGSKDNMTVIVIRLRAQNIGDGGGVEARRQQRLAVAESNKTNHYAGDD